jgi:hypothetical protein
MITFIVYANHTPQKLERFLSTLLSQTNQSFEAFVLDESNDKYALHIKEPGRYVSHNINFCGASNSSDWGYSTANWCAKEIVCAPHLIFCNDDDILYPTLVQDVLDKFKETDADIIYWDMIHRRISAGTFVTAPRVGQIDKSAFSIKREVFLKLNGFEDKSYLGDGRFIEKAVAANCKFAKIEKVLLDKE